MRWLPTFVDQIRIAASLPLSRRALYEALRNEAPDHPESAHHPPVIRNDLLELLRSAPPRPSRPRTGWSASSCCATEAQDLIAGLEEEGCVEGLMRAETVARPLPGRSSAAGRMDRGGFRAV